MSETRTSDVKETVIRESINLFLANGYRGTSVKEITKAAGISRGTLYWYFKSKDEILVKIFERFEQWFVEGLIEAVNKRGGDFVAKYRAFHKFATEFARDQRELAIVFNTLLNEIVGTNTEPERVVKRIYGRYRGFLESVIKEGQTEGSVRADLDASVYAHVIVASHTGMLVEWFVNSDSLDVGPFVRAFRDIILKSVTEG